MDGPESRISPQTPLSPPGSPLRAHESIWKRSKKILGMSRFAFLQQIDAQGPRGMSCLSITTSSYYQFIACQPAATPSISFHSTHPLPLAVQAGVLLFAMVLPEDTVALSPVQALSFLTLRTKLISWLDKNSPEGSDGANGKPPVSKRREQVRRAQK
jgi:hypothetical protein